MTTLVALQGQGWAGIACDSRATEGSRPYTLPKEICKVVKNGTYLIGVTGDLKNISLIEYSFNPSTPQATLSLKELDKFMTQVFIPEFRDFLKETSLSTKEDEEIIAPGLLVLINGTVYDIDATLTWLRDPSGIYAEGSGSDFAHGSMLTAISDAGKDIDTIGAKKIMSGAISNAIKMDLMTGGPVHVFIQLSKTKN